MLGTLARTSVLRSAAFPEPSQHPGQPHTEAYTGSGEQRHESEYTTTSHRLPKRFSCTEVDSATSLPRTRHPVSSPQKMRFKNKSVFIAGAGSGIGRAAALAFAAEGARIAVYDLSGDAARETTDQIHASGGEALALQGDVADWLVGWLPPLGCRRRRFSTAGHSQHCQCRRPRFHVVSGAEAHKLVRRGRRASVGGCRCDAPSRASRRYR